MATLPVPPPAWRTPSDKSSRSDRRQKKGPPDQTSAGFFFVYRSVTMTPNRTGVLWHVSSDAYLRRCRAALCQNHLPKHERPADVLTGRFALGPSSQQSEAAGQGRGAGFG